MSKIKLYIATTIDRYIAREDGSLDWLESLENPNGYDYGYGEFYGTIDTLIIGRSTYDEILGFDVEWPYADCKTYIITSDQDYKTTTPNTQAVNELDESFINSIKESAQKDIWIFGGGKLITEFLNMNAIDEMLLTIIPVILGSGIPLFPDNPRETNFELINSESFDTGIVNLTYRKK